MSPARATAPKLPVDPGSKQRPTRRYGTAVVVVGLVLAAGAGLWLRTAGPGQGPEGLASSEAVASLAQAYAERHGPSTEASAHHRAEARRLEHSAPRSAAEHLTRALARDPGDSEAWLHLVVLSCRSQAVQELGPVQAEAVVQAVERARSDAPLLPAARAWLALQAGAPEQTLEELGPPEANEPADARWARLRASMELGTHVGEPAAHLLSADPANPEGCGAASRAALADGDWFSAEQRADTCLALGVQASTLHRVKGEVAWVLGEPAAAAASWEQAGLGLHASAALAADGQLDAAWRRWDEAADEVWIPPVAVRGLWLGLQQPDLALVAEARQALAASGMPDPSVRHAWAAGELALGNTQVALGVLDGLTDPLALFLRARATKSPTDVEAAFRANPTEAAVAALAAEVLGDDAWRLVEGEAPLLLHLQRRLPSIDEPWQVFPQTVPDAAAWRALVGQPGPRPDAGAPLEWWTAAQGRADACPRDASPPTRAWCLRHGGAPRSEALLAEVSAGSAAREILDAVWLEGDETDASLARILDARPALAGLARERYDRRVRAEERSPTP